jgi:hypothetical protein
MAMDLGSGFVFLAISALHPDRVRVGRSADLEHEAADSEWRIAYSRRVHFPQTIERIMRDHLSRLQRGILPRRHRDDNDVDGAYVAPYGHVQMVLDSLAQEFDVKS